MTIMSRTATSASSVGFAADGALLTADQRAITIGDRTLAGAPYGASRRLRGLPGGAHVLAEPHVLDTTTGARIARVEQHVGAETAADVTRDGRLAIIAGEDRPGRCCRGEDSGAAEALTRGVALVALGELATPPEIVWHEAALTVAAGARHVAATTWNTLFVWPATPPVPGPPRRPLLQVSMTPGTIRALHWLDTDDQMLAAIFSDGTSRALVGVYRRADDWRSAGRWPIDAPVEASVARRSSGELLIGTDADLRIYSPAGALHATLPLGGWVIALALAPDETRAAVIVGHDGGMAELLRIALTP
jgi:hypothetical protein